MLWPLAGLAACLAAPVSGLLEAPVAGAATGGLGACRAGGVVVVVDFARFGAAVDLGCARGRPSSGLEAMHRAGFLTAGDEADGDDFVCRIGVAAKGAGSERPTAQQQACVATPPASAYWSFWVAAGRQDRWSYASLGAASYRPPVRSEEAFTFGTGRPPAITPLAARAAASERGGRDLPKGLRLVAAPAEAPGGASPAAAGSSSGLFLAGAAVAALGGAAAIIAVRRRRAL